MDSVVEDFQWSCVAAYWILQVLLRSMPGRPQKGKWTRYFPALMWHIPLMGFFSFLRGLALSAFQAFRMLISKAGATARDPSTQQEFHWHEVRSIRYTTFFENLTGSMLIEMIIIGIVFEVLKSICKWFKLLTVFSFTSAAVFVCG